MTYDEALEKAAKLLRLAQSSNPHEAALAASRAQDLMQRFQIDNALAELAATGNGVGQPQEEVKDFGFDPLDKAGRLERWKGQLGLGLAKLHGCSCYRSGGDLKLIGRASDVSTVRYMFSWLNREIKRLAAEDCRGCGITYAKDFKLGAVETIVARLREQAGLTRKAAVAEAQSQVESGNALALVRMSQALERVEKRLADAEAYGKEKLHLRAGRSSRSNYSPTGREAGRQAGHRVSLGQSVGSLGRGVAGHLA